MNREMKAAIWLESLRVRRSVIPWAIPLVGLMIGCLPAGLFLVVLRHPNQARALGLFGTQPDWGAYLTLAAQIAAIAGFGLFVVISAWMFGREFKRGTRSASPRPSSRVGGIVLVALHWSVLLVIEIALIGAVFDALFSAGILTPADPLAAKL